MGAETQGVGLGGSSPPKKSKFKEQLIEAWGVIEALIEAGAEPQSITSLAKSCKLKYSKTRRILLTWERLELVERKGNHWTYSKYLVLDIPRRLQAEAANRYRELEGSRTRAIG